MNRRTFLRNLAIGTAALGMHRGALGAVAGEAIAHRPSFTLWQLPEQTPTQMMSYVIRTMNDSLIVIDGGNLGDAPYLREFIQKQGGAVHTWIVSHPHSDHTDALATLLSEPECPAIGRIVASLPEPAWIEEHEQPALEPFQRFLKAVEEAGVPLHEVELGETMDVEGVRIEVIAVKNLEIHANAINNSSMAFRVEDDVKSVLFLGDLGFQGGDKLLAGPYASRLKADYVQMAHHGQNGVSEAVYQAIVPKCCLWPTPAWLWENDNGGGKGSGPWRTLEVRDWMARLGVTNHLVSKDGLFVIH
ncbi:MAG: MBL fold metallo-hydrolase [Nitrospiraceae bacterium]|nr:MBL fold metallo-hydrolase [Nitrospiraceae bacterium]